MKETVLMLGPRDINWQQILRIEEIERNETWLAGEREGRPVDPKSPQVQLRVSEIVLELAPSWREELESWAMTMTMTRDL